MQPLHETGEYITFPQLRLCGNAFLKFKYLLKKTPSYSRENARRLRHKQIKVPYVVCADFEALTHVQQIHLCDKREGITESYTDKMELHEACGFGYKVVRCNSEVFGQRVYRGENVVGMSLKSIIQEEVAIRENLVTPKPLVMTAEDWEKQKT